MPRKQEPLSRERVLDAAMEVTDAEGLAALTMRRLATALGVEAMSLYHHVPNKEALLDGLVETVLTEIDTALAATDRSDAGHDWRAVLCARFLTARTVMVRHPWAPALIGSRPSVPPSLWTYYEDILATMVGGGLPYDLAHRALHALGSMTLGFTQELFSPTSAGGSADVEVSEAELAAMAETLPHLTAMVASEIHAADGDVLGWCDSRTEFEFTLDLLLDGLDRARLERD